MTVRRTLLGALLLAVVASLMIAAPSLAADESIVGDWEGMIAAQLRVVFHVTADEEGNLSATHDSPDQGAFGVPFDSVEYADGQLELGLAAAQAGYVGTVSEDASTMEGTWTQGGQSLPLVMERKE